jgi:hypothetical protein
MLENTSKLVILAVKNAVKTKPLLAH